MNARNIWYAALLLFFATAFAVRCTNTPSPPPAPSTISMAASAWNITYSPGMPAHPTATLDGWKFDFPTKLDSVHYVMAPVNMAVKQGQKVRAQFVIDGTVPEFDYHTEKENTCDGQASVRFMLQRQGGDMATPYGRWWSNPAHMALTLLTLGSLSVELQPSLWSSVYGEFGNASSAATVGFNDVLAHLGAVGFTFGGGCFFGHGVWLLGGEASFTLKKFSIE